MQELTDRRGRGRARRARSDQPERAIPVERLEEHDELADVWSALANPIRRRILDVLRDGPLTTGELADLFPDRTRFAVMQHLDVLTKADLVVPRREGRSRFNYLNPVPIQRIHDRWVSRYVRPWAEALVDLRDELEAEAADDRQGRAGAAGGSEAGEKSA